jgi:hypothetical protein
MKNTDLKNKTTEKLESELKGIKISSWILIGILIPLFALTIYGLITDKSSSDLSLLVIAFSCIAIILSQFSNMKKIKAELNSRNENK